MRFLEAQTQTCPHCPFRVTLSQCKSPAGGETEVPSWEAELHSHGAKGLGRRRGPVPPGKC